MCGSMGDTQTGVFKEEAEETVNDLLQHYQVPENIAAEAKRLCERGDPITALDILVKNR